MLFFKLHDKCSGLFKLKISKIITMIIIMIIIIIRVEGAECYPTITLAQTSPLQPREVAMIIKSNCKLTPAMN